MVTASKKFPSTKEWLLGRADPESLEAPDRNFIGHRDILTRSQARYAFVAPHLHGVALDVGCGRGYGFRVIQDHTSAQFGIDVSPASLRSVLRKGSAVSPHAAAATG